LQQVPNNRKPWYHWNRGESGDFRHVLSGEGEKFLEEEDEDEGGDNKAKENGDHGEEGHGRNVILM
jgi:hypothetical protein